VAHAVGAVLCNVRAEGVWHKPSNSKDCAKWYGMKCANAKGVPIEDGMWYGNALFMPKAQVSW